MATLPKKVAFQREHSGDHALDRVQRLTQQVAAAHEQTKTYLATFQGLASVAMKDANQTITPSQAQCFNIRATGAITAARIVSGFPLPADDASSYSRFLWNNTTGGFNVTFQCGTGTTAVIGSGGGAFVMFTTAGAAIFAI